MIPGQVYQNKLTGKKLQVRAKVCDRYIFGSANQFHWFDNPLLEGASLPDTGPWFLAPSEPLPKFTVVHEDGRQEDTVYDRWEIARKNIFFRRHVSTTKDGLWEVEHFIQHRGLQGGSVACFKYWYLVHPDNIDKPLGDFAKSEESVTMTQAEWDKLAWSAHFPPVKHVYRTGQVYRNRKTFKLIRIQTKVGDRILYHEILRHGLCSEGAELPGESWEWELVEDKPDRSNPTMEELLKPQYLMELRVLCKNPVKDADFDIFNHYFVESVVCNRVNLTRYQYWAEKSNPNHILTVRVAATEFAESMLLHDWQDMVKCLLSVKDTNEHCADGKFPDRHVLSLECLVADGCADLGQTCGTEKKYNYSVVERAIKRGDYDHASRLLLQILYLSGNPHLLSDTEALYVLGLCRKINISSHGEEIPGRLLNIVKRVNPLWDIQIIKEFESFRIPLERYINLHQ